MVARVSPKAVATHRISKYLTSLAAVFGSVRFRVLPALLVLDQQMNLDEQ
jgi:hypothetical protein